MPRIHPAVDSGAPKPGAPSESQVDAVTSCDCGVLCQCQEQRQQGGAPADVEAATVPNGPQFTAPAGTAVPTQQQLEQQQQVMNALQEIVTHVAALEVTVKEATSLAKKAQEAASKKPEFQPTFLGRLAVLLPYYQIFAGTVFLVNVLLLGLVAGGAWPLDYQSISLVSIVNLLIAVFVRQELMLNFLYWAVAKMTPHVLALHVREMAARALFHVGGLHAGCALSALMWFIYAYAETIMHFRSVGWSGADVAIVAVDTALVVLVLALVVSSKHKIRGAIHDTWERMHRFGGWSCVLLLWAHIGILGSQVNLLQEPLIWLAVIITVLVIFPWAFVRKQRVTIKSPSPHVAVITFPIDCPPSGYFGRVSKGGLMEWHSFATIGTKDGSAHQMIVASAGDWTKDLIANPPSHLWVRRIRCPGFMYTVRMFKRTVLVGSGAGIAPVLPYIITNHPGTFVLWITRTPVQTFGQELVDIISSHPAVKVVDTAAGGRPDTVGLVLQAYKDFNAEAIHIVSNEPLTKKVVAAAQLVGITAFGAIWDS